MTGLQLAMMNTASRHGCQTQWGADGVVYVYLPWTMTNSQGHVTRHTTAIAVNTMAKLYLVLGY